MRNFEKPIFVTKSFLPPFDDYIKMLDLIWESHWLTNQGSVHEELQLRLRDYLKVQHVTLFANGHLALDCAIRSLGLKGEVITTPFTFPSTIHAIMMNGLKPLFCDIKLTDCNMNEEKIEALITPKTSAIIPVHVYGNPCNVTLIQYIAHKYGLKVIYDAAHAFGVEVDGSGIGSFGDVSMFSFHATKVFNTVEGGALTYNCPNYKKSFDLLKNFGITGPENVEMIGINAKMNEFQAAMGVINLKYINDEITNRKKVADKYRQCLQLIDGIRCLDDIKGVKHNYAYFPIIIDEKAFGMTRNDLYEKLYSYNVHTRKYFYPLVTQYECYKSMFNFDEIPIAKYVADRVLTLPMYGTLDLVDVEDICDIIRYLQKL